MNPENDVINCAVNTVKNIFSTIAAYNGCGLTLFSSNTKVHENPKDSNEIEYKVKAL